ncbi:ABC transporter permease [Agriterribacter sp.]|uniref:ABC transporter permease n=1 Tax=Agriterribacter sp. TaxID=2821509 RepID=UPI002C2D746F|nr:ABC transporter permease [Agriterribacter sp.]HRP54593.1 ABC transporter permease [Agriterribacter sp.]
MFRNHLTTALRTIRRNKIFSGINILGLALGLAAFWLIVLYIADELSYDRYNANAERIVRVAQHARWSDNNIHVALTSAPFAPALKTAFPEIEDAVRINTEGGGIITYGDKSIKQGDIVFADKSLLYIFSYNFLYGNAASALSHPNSVVLTNSLAIKLFGNAEKAFNQTIYFDKNFPATVTAVIKDIPDNSHLRFSAVRPFPAEDADNWQNFSIYTYLLLKKGADHTELEKKLPAFAAGTIQKIMGITDYKMELQPLTSIHLHSNLGYELSTNGNINRVYIFAAIAMLILIIAMINYMNLTTALSASRIKEIGVRKAIGSGKRSIAGMFITEAVLVTCIAALIATFIVSLTLPLFNELTAKELPANRFGILNTILCLITFSLLTGFINGIYPSLFLARFKPVPALKGELGRQSGSILFRKSLLVFQFVITVVMIAGAVIIYQQLQYALHTNLGFNKDEVLTFHIDDKKVRDQVPALKSQLLQSPLIKSVAAAGNPIGNNNLGGNGYKYEENNGAASDHTKIAQELMVDADFVNTMEIKLIEGRNFSDAMPADQSGSVLVNETLVRELGWKEPVGKQILKASDDDGNTAPKKVIGVIKDFHTYSLQHKIEPLVMVMPPAASDEDNLYVRIAKGKIPQGLAYIDKVYRRFDKTNQATYSFLDQNFAKQYKAEEKQGQIALLFSILAVFIACLGLFGLATFSASQRIKEIGIRKVLGASVAGIVILLSKDFLKLVLIALCIAVPIAWYAMNKWLEDFAYRIELGGSVFIIAGITALAIALLTVSFQAIKAAVANPVKSLRTE